MPLRRQHLCQLRPGGVVSSLTMRYHISNADLDTTETFAGLTAEPAPTDWAVLRGAAPVRRSGMNIHARMNAAWRASDDPCALLAATVEGLVSVLMGSPWMALAPDVSFR